jgi:phosphoribosylformylglycinamidine synthase I
MMRTGILVFPGINRERDMAIAVERSFGVPARIVWHKETMAAVRAHAARGGYVLGVCNGFQILTEAGLLPGALLRNAGLRFLSMDTLLRVERADTVFTSQYQAGEVFRAPMAHGDGNYTADAAVLDRLEGEGLVAFRYAEQNHNGSARAIAGIFSDNHRTLGLMPHPEDLVDPLMGGTDGKPLFDSLAAA